MVLKYTEKVLDHFRNPRNAGEMNDATTEATEGSLACGDMMTIYLKIENDTIVDAKFESYGCAANIATGSMLTEMIKGKSIEYAENLTWDDLVHALDDLPQIKYHCSTLSIETLHSALKKYRESNDGTNEIHHTEKGGLLKKIESKLDASDTKEAMD